MVSPQAKREAVTVLMKERCFGVTRACGLVGISRSLHRYRSRRPDSAPLRKRIEEIAVLAKFLADRTTEASAWAKNMILLGDFNIFDTTDQTMKAITDAKFVIPKQIQRNASNALRNKHYDQIAFIAPDIQDELELCNAGVFDFYTYVYRHDKEFNDELVYKEAMGPAYLTDKTQKQRDEKGRTRYYKDWRTFQMSDHLPLWIELKIDFGKEYLQKKIEQKLAPTKTLDPLGMNIDL